MRLALRSVLAVGGCGDIQPVQCKPHSHDTRGQVLPIL